MALKLESDGVFENAGVPVLYCGVGKINAALGLAGALHEHAKEGVTPPLVVNFGTVGSRVHPTGTLLGCHEFVQRDMDVRGLGFPLGVTPYDETPARLRFEPYFPSLPSAVCGSGDSFAIAEVELSCTVVDMEAYALAKVCHLAGVPFACAKYVTDGADGAAPEDWKRNVHKAAEIFLNLYRELQKNL
ncbi:MAG TPA: 5'-nucleosidase [Steroidobacteraceae bacterium]|jgi:adenosylhomocysteine nucleosidase